MDIIIIISCEDVARVEPTGNLPPAILVALPDSATSGCRLDEQRRLMINRQQYCLGGVTYYANGHYTVKLFLPPTFDKWCVCDNNKAHHLRRSKPRGRPNCFFILNVRLRKNFIFLNMYTSRYC